MIELLFTPTVARILAFMISLHPIRSFNDFEMRWMLAAEIARETDDTRRQEVLARLGWLEGSYSRAVASCKILGDHGASHGLFQIKPQTPREKKHACGTLREQVHLANEKIDHGAAACPKNMGADTLAMYVSGTCARGIPQSKARWGNPEKGALDAPSTLAQERVSDLPPPEGRPDPSETF